MPFLPLVLLLAWQAISKSASFALGWATALYFGQVPGRQGRMLSVVSLLAAAWVILVLGFAVPILVGAILEATGVIEENFDVELIHYAGLAAAVAGVPPALAGVAVWGEFHPDRRLKRWLGLVPMSYPSAAMLGAAVLQMVAFTPVLIFQRYRQRRKYVQVPLVLREGADDDDLTDAIGSALRSIGIAEVAAAEAKGPKAWPLRTVGFAAEHMLGAVVRGEPMRLAADGIEIYAYATNISIQGPKEQTYRVRAAIERELAFSDVYLTWSDDAQSFEDALIETHRKANGDLDRLRRRLDEIQRKLDVASLNSGEWNVLYRRRLQIEQAAARRHPDEEASSGAA